jgi:BirA family transcriptional regulator, biotin operon repressor / biotin---[acetyl-CoA-carboxylase] ligase
MLAGNTIIELKTIDSTNRYAIELARDSTPPEGTAVIAGFQSDGQGQHGNSWCSDENANLLLSIILYPRFLLPADLFLLIQTVSLAITDFIKLYVDVDQVFIKWPNDIMAGDSKMSGILINNIIEQDEIKTSVVGIGINVNQMNFPQDIPPATSLKKITFQTFNLVELRQLLFECFNFRYWQLEQKQADSIRLDYSRSLYMLEKDCKFKDKNDRIFDGKINGVENDGRIRIISDQKILYFQFKEVSFVR